VSAREVWALWWGGPGYSVPDVTLDMERFDSIGAARAEFWQRYLGACTQRDANGRMVWHGDSPNVTAEATMDLFYYDPRAQADPYPDRRISFGPRGGIRTENC
jgi:hypothetical protein